VNDEKLSDIDLLNHIHSLLPSDYQEVLAVVLLKFTNHLSEGGLETDNQAQAIFSRYWYIYKLYNEKGRYELSQLEKHTYPKWREFAENLYLKMQNRAATA